MTDGPLLWYFNRGTGVVLLVLLSLSVVLGVLAMGGRPGRGLPRFVSQSLHRNLALLSIVALVAHVVTAVVDTYVDIRWWQAIVPAGATYEPVWLGLGTLSLDLLAVVTLTSLLRTRLGHRSWRAVHLVSWLAWGAAVVHSVGIGTDLASPSGLAVLPVAGCVAAVVVALAVRLGRAVRRAPGLSPAPAAAPAPAPRRWA
jgi:sulfoxide reductase heme-binding subunit YedZ